MLLRDRFFLRRRRLTPLSTRFFPAGYIYIILYTISILQYIIYRREAYSKLYLFFFFFYVVSQFIGRFFLHSFRFVHRYSARVILYYCYLLLLLFVIAALSVFFDGQIDSSRDLRGHRVVTISRWWIADADTSNRSDFAPTPRPPYLTTAFTPTHIYLQSYYIHRCFFFLNVRHSLF